MLILAVSVIAILVAHALDVGDEHRVVIPVAGISLPRLCTYQQITGHDCPGCGLTRSFVSLAGGDFASAWSYNVVGPFLFGFVVLQIPFRTLQIWRLTSGRSAIRLGSELWIIWPFSIALLAQWMIRSLFHFVV